jgi:hypothetical protein
LIAFHVILKPLRIQFSSEGKQQATGGAPHNDSYTATPRLCYVVKKRGRDDGTSSHTVAELERDRRFAPAGEFRLWIAFVLGKPKRGTIRLHV